MKRKKRAGYTVGTSLVLVTFVLMALVVFATLSYSTASADYKLSQDAADNTSEYYKANEQANLELSNIYTALSDIKESSLDYENYYDRICEKFQGKGINVSFDGMNIVMAYNVDINDGQRLMVKLKVCSLEETKMFTIVKWSVSNKEEEIEEDSIRLMF